MQSPQASAFTAEEKDLHVEALHSLECIISVALCPNLEAVRRNALAFRGELEEGNKSQNTIFRLFRAELITTEHDIQELIGSQCR